MHAVKCCRLSGLDVAVRLRFADNAVQVANRPTLEAEMGAVFGSLPRAEAISRLEAAQIAWGWVKARVRPFVLSRAAARSGRDAERSGANGPTPAR